MTVLTLLTSESDGEARAEIAERTDDDISIFRIEASIVSVGEFFSLAI